MTPFRLGLTGSIGMGKSTTAGIFAAAGVPVWDADAAVHRLYGRGGAAVGPVSRLWPQVLQAADRDAFLRAARADIVVFDIPLLFEKGSEAAMDATLLVTAPPALQKARVLARPGMTEALFEAIHARQMPDAEKRMRATHIVETLGFSVVETYVSALISHIRKVSHA